MSIAKSDSLCFWRFLLMLLAYYLLLLLSSLSSLLLHTHTHTTYFFITASDSYPSRPARANPVQRRGGPVPIFRRSRSSRQVSPIILCRHHQHQLCLRLLMIFVRDSSNLLWAPIRYPRSRNTVHIQRNLWDLLSTICRTLMFRPNSKYPTEVLPAVSFTIERETHESRITSGFVRGAIKALDERFK